MSLVSTTVRTLHLCFLLNAWKLFLHIVQSLALVYLSNPASIPLLFLVLLGTLKMNSQQFRLVLSYFEYRHEEPDGIALVLSDWLKHGF